MSRFLEVLGLTLSVIFSIGAVIGAMITMYGSVASRTAEIGTLRAIGFPRGFPRRSILQAFLLEALSLLQKADIEAVIPPKANKIEQKD